MGRNRQRRGRHAPAQPAAASASVFASAPPIAAGRWPGRSGAAGSAASRGAKHRAAGIARRAFPRRQAKRAAPQARRREGLKPNGRDGMDGTGRSPKARRRLRRHAHSTRRSKRADGNVGYFPICREPGFFNKGSSSAGTASAFERDIWRKLQNRPRNLAHSRRVSDGGIERPFVVATTIVIP